MSEKMANEALTKLAESVDNVLPRRNNQILRTLSNHRLTISDILAKYVVDGKIPKGNLTKLLNELSAVEAEMYRNLRSDLQSVVKGITEQSTATLTGPIITAIGIPALMSFIGIESANVLTTEALFSAVVGIGVLDFITSIVTSTFNRTGDDGKKLNDRLRAITSLLMNEVRTLLRKTIGQGEDPAVIVRELNRVFDENDWRVSTIVETESLFAMRQSIAKFAETSGAVKALKIIDFPHGHEHEHGDHYHHRHKCYIYAHSDEHGLGKGVYPVTTRKIRNPHPQCRAIIHFVLVDELA